MRDFETGLTQERLKSLLCYCHETGLWKWLVSVTARIPAGAEAGCKSTSGYTVIRVDGFLYQAHRLAHFYMTGEWPPQIIDHEDLGKTNNEWSNIRPATHQENNRNTKISPTNTTGFKCVSFDKRRGKFRAYIKASRRQTFLGYYDTAEEAHAAYVKAATETFGEFARAG